MTRTRTNAGAGDGRTGSTLSLQPQWSDLPDDILDNIRLKVASLRDRVLLAAVCKPWRATMTRLPATAAPVLLLLPRDTTGKTRYQCRGGSDDSWVMPIPDKVAGRWIIGSHEGGWVAAFDYVHFKLMLVNLFSGAEVGVCSLRNFITHVILSDDPTSSRGCILATIGYKQISLCKVGCSTKWTKHGWEKKEFRNIAFYNGDLYGLTYPDEELIKFKIGMNGDGSPMVISTHHMAIQRQHGHAVYTSYILELQGKLLKATMTHWLPNREPFFKVFELIDVDTYDTCQHKWAEVTTLDNYALFLGPGKSKAVYVPMGAERRGFERNHIYYSLFRESKPRDEVYSMRSNDGPGMYSIKDRSIDGGLERARYQEYLETSMWLHPPAL